ncbi:hypothetical protein [Enhygromyxa salina]|nr:hypothetical protein [Enhygromyxa salina]
MTDRFAAWLSTILLLIGLGQVTGCRFNCGELEPVKSGEYMILNLYGQLNPDFADLVGAQLIVDRDTETSVIRYTRDGTTYEVRHSLTEL